VLSSNTDSLALYPKLLLPLLFLIFHILPFSYVMYFLTYHFHPDFFFLLGVLFFVLSSNCSLEFSSLFILIKMYPYHLILLVINLYLPEYLFLHSLSPGFSFHAPKT